MSRKQTLSEYWFEQYLGIQKLPFKYEPHQQGQDRRPDYVITGNGYEVACDVKEFQERAVTPVINELEETVGQIMWTDGGDRSVKNKLFKAYGQFHAHRHLPCCVVLATNDPLIEITDPHVMLGSMYGRVELELLYNPKTGKVLSKKHVFDTGGRMLDTETGKIRNTAISALISLRSFNLGQMSLRKLYRQYKDNFDNMPEHDFDVGEYMLGVIVWENIFAKIPLPRDIFCGEYDQRYGLIKPDFIDRIYAGTGVLQYEKDDAEE